jgi:hypothetical protein
LKIKHEEAYAGIQQTGKQSENINMMLSSFEVRSDGNADQLPYHHEYDHVGSIVEVGLTPWPFLGPWNEEEMKDFTDIIYTEDMKDVTDTMDTGDMKKKTKALITSIDTTLGVYTVATFKTLHEGETPTLNNFKIDTCPDYPKVNQSSLGERGRFLLRGPGWFTAA